MIVSYLLLYHLMLHIKHCNCLSERIDCHYLVIIKKSINLKSKVKKPFFCMMKEKRYKFLPWICFSSIWLKRYKRNLIKWYKLYKRAHFLSQKNFILDNFGQTFWLKADVIFFVHKTLTFYNKILHKIHNIFKRIFNCISRLKFKYTIEKYSNHDSISCSTIKIFYQCNLWSTRALFKGWNSARTSAH